MNTLLVTILVSMVAFSAASQSSGAVVVGPSGVVTNNGAIGPHGSELGHGWGVGSGLGLGLGAGLGLGLGADLGLGHGLGHAAVVVAPTYHAAPISYAAPVIAHHSVDIAPVKIATLTPGGGSIAVSAHGAAIQGPPTVPVVVAGPSGKISADGLWGPTANVGHTYGHGW